MYRVTLVLMTLLAAARCEGQSGNTDSTAAVTFSHTFTAPLSRAQLFDAAQIAWQRSFGLEPAAKLAVADRENGVLEGTARMNYRSALLTAREETMGVVTYRVTVAAANGECSVRVTQLLHTGNRNAMHGGLSFGLLTGAMVPTAPHPGVSHRNAVRIYGELKEQAGQRVNDLVNAFGSTLRQVSQE